MKASERFRNIMLGKPFDRLPVVEWAPYWDQTVDRWRTEGLPDSCQTYYEIQKYFGLDGCCQSYFRWNTAQTPQPKEFGAGIIKNEEDYERILPTLYPEPHLDDEYVAWLKKTRDEEDALHWFTVEGFFWQPRELMGIEDHLYSFYDQPELYHRICSDNAAWIKRVFEYVLNTFDFDFMTYAEDMSYNQGPMISKEIFDEFLAPYYRQVTPILKDKVFQFIDSDGDVTKAVDWFASIGANGMLPLERHAGVDVSVYIKKQPQMGFLGHFDKLQMKFGEEAMRKEFERILPSARSGKVIIGCDHQTPPEVSIENYRTFIRLFREYAVLAAQK